MTSAGDSTAVEHSADSADRAEAAVKLLGDRLNNEVTEALRASLQSVTFRRVENTCDYDEKTYQGHYCDARCDKKDILINGGCFVRDGAIGLISSSSLGPDYVWNCTFVQGQPWHQDTPRLTKISAFAYCAKLPESFHAADVAQPTSAQAQCNPNASLLQCCVVNTDNPLVCRTLIIRSLCERALRFFRGQVPPIGGTHVLAVG
jgi:hypothetical protein